MIKTVQELFDAYWAGEHTIACEWGASLKAICYEHAEAVLVALTLGLEPPDRPDDLDSYGAVPT